MSTLLDKGNNRNKCQKFTPNGLVDTMLDLAEYSENSNLIGKSVLENSFGSGNILKKIVERYIKSGIHSGFSKEYIANSLSNDIFGVEYDKNLYDQCVISLNEITHEYEIPQVNWNLKNEDALFLNYPKQFDYIIGNPPYISYKEMDSETRERLKDKFITCKFGKFDYCYAFLELGVSLLKKSGKMVQLIPNNLYKNVFASKLRDILKDKVSIIYDYPKQKLFDKTLTSISIFVYDNSNTNSFIHHVNMTDDIETQVNRNNLGIKWMFSNNIENPINRVRFGDVFNASVTIATLCNEAYLVSDEDIEDNKLELEIIKRTASPKMLSYNKTCKIIFPYKYKNERLTRINDTDFERCYPNISNYLKNYSEKLMSRNSDKNIQWFEYGRSQALTHLNCTKLLMSTIITNKVEVYTLDDDTIPYSGIYITVKNPEYTLDDAITILKSKCFYDYISNIGINISGASIRITCKDINNYTFIRRV